MNNVGINLKKIRKARGVTQIQLAKVTGLTSDYISKLELGKRENPSIEVTQKLADALDVSVEDLADLKEAKKIVKKIEQEIFPEKFEDANKARMFVKIHQVFEASDFDADKLTDEEIIKFANDVLEMMKLVTYKYKK